MVNHQEDRERDDQLDRQIENLLAGRLDPSAQRTGEERVAQEFARLAAEESPRLSSAARTQGLNALRARAAEKRAARRSDPFAFLHRVPRWAQIVAVALVVVIIANGVSNAAADSLPGSPLYPFKRFTEGGQLLLQNTNGQRAQLWMSFANTRLDEVQRLLRSGAQVNPAYLDAVDESILRAISEIAGTRGNERIELLKQLTQLAIRQQQTIDQLAQNAAPDERERLEQTAKLLAGIASYAQSSDAAQPDAKPFDFLTPSATPSPTSTRLSTSTATATDTASPVPTPFPTATPEPTAPRGAEPSSTPEPENSNSGPSTPKPDDNSGKTQEPAKTDEPEPTDKPDKTKAPDPTDKPEKTEEPEPTEKPEKTKKPDPTDKPEKTDEPDETDDSGHHGPSASNTPKPTKTPEH